MASIQYMPIEYARARDVKAPGALTRMLEFLTKGWRAEWICMTLSIACTAATGIILATSNGLPEPAWTRHVSLNALVAYIMTLEKLAMMYAVASCLSQLKWLYYTDSDSKLESFELLDQASRGPTGSAVYLTTVFTSVFTWAKCLAAVAALATVLSVFTSAFAQQLVKTSLRAVSVDRDALFHLSHNYSAGAQENAGGYGLFDPLFSTADADMHGAIYSGIFNATPPAVYSCASSCVWDDADYVSLGFRSTCENVTAAALQTGRTTVYSWESNYTVTTPHGINLTARFGYTDYRTAIAVATGRNFTSSTFPAGFEIFGVLRTGKSLQYEIDPSLIEVYECTLHFTAYRYANISANGTELVIGHTDMVALEPAAVVNPSLSHEDATAVVFNQSGLPVLSARTHDIGGFLQLLESERFSGSIYDGESYPSEPRGIGEALLSGNISDAFSSMAASMTAQLQLSDAASAVRGDTIRQVLYVDINWYYGVLPVLVQVLSILLLALTAYLNARRHVTLWKASTIAALCHEIVPGDGAVNKLRTSVQSVEELRLLEDSKVRMS